MLLLPFIINDAAVQHQAHIFNFYLLLHQL
jgi:hypothetical protein